MSLLPCTDEANAGNEDYRDRRQSLEINLENHTPFLLEFVGDYFDSGVWYSNPGAHSVKPQRKRRYIVTSRVGSVFTGVTGVLKYKYINCNNNNSSIISI